MSSLDQYLDNPHWAAMYNYGMGPVNNGAYKRWVQGSPGMNDPMPIYSNEYAHLYMKHGQSDVLSYRGNIKQFAPSVNQRLKNQVTQCSRDTINPAGCQTAAVRKVYSTDSSPRRAASPHGTRYAPDITPHPFDVSYQTGYSPSSAYVPPDVHYGY